MRGWGPGTGMLRTSGATYSTLSVLRGGGGGGEAVADR